MNVDDPDDRLALGGAAAKDARTVLVWPSTETTTFGLREDDDATTTLAPEAARRSRSWRVPS